MSEEPTAESSTDDAVAEEPVAEEPPAAIKARKLVVLSRPAVDDESEKPEGSDDD